MRSYTFFWITVFLFFPIFSYSSVINDEWLSENYGKREVYITMRDGIKLFTSIYEPLDPEGGVMAGRPVIITRTPYGCAPYGKGYSKTLSDYMHNFVEAKYIVVFQDVRGRYMSEGKYENVRPFRPGKQGTETDEASDAYDTVEWLLGNTANNGNMGVCGVSYPGFYATMAALSGHPAIKAVSPQAPILDWYMGDDAHHNGVFMLLDTYSFGGSFYRKCDNPTKKIPSAPDRIDKDVYTFFLEKQTMRNITASLADTLEFWNQMMQHPDYDSFWQERSLIPHLKDIAPAVLVVGGTFDRDDCFGAVNTYKLIRENSPETDLHFVYGPWYHGGWHNASYSGLGRFDFGEGISEYFMDNIEYPFFRYYLEGKGESLPEVFIYPSGCCKWLEYEKWPSDDVVPTEMYFREGGILGCEIPDERKSFSAYVSDPSNPVLFYEKNKRDKNYMVGDQRFVSERQDVLVFESEPRNDTLKLEGPVGVSLFVSASTADADFTVKLIDVHPDGYQMLVRGDVFRARYRKSFEFPGPMRPGKCENIRFTMADVAHYVLPGHKIMVQIQSTWFPLTDINPQKYVDNIYEAAPEDFVKSRIKVFHQKKAASCIVLPVKSGNSR